MGVGGIGTNLSVNEGSLGMPKFFHFNCSPQQKNVSPDYFLIIIILVPSFTSKVCIS